MGGELSKLLAEQFLAPVVRAMTSLLDILKLTFNLEFP
jgi:hypothetical protein